MSDPKPIYLGTFGPFKAGDVLDRHIALSIGTGADGEIADLVTGEAISSVAFAVTNAAGETVASVIGAHTETDTRTDFRITAPAAGAYTLTATFTIDDGQQITRTATIRTV